MVIESQGQLDKVIELVKTKNFFIQVLCDTIKKHPSDDKISVIMLYFDEWYVVPFDHIDCINLSDAQQEQFLVELVCSNTKKYCVDKKRLLHLVKCANLIDLKMSRYLSDNEVLDDEDFYTNTQQIFHYEWRNLKKINNLLPITKLIEYTTKIYDSYKSYNNHQECSDVYHNLMLESYQTIESNGIQTTDGIVYSEYNPFTSTGRPSNRFGGINFAALNKKDGSRKKFISRFGQNGKLVEMDYDAYHLRLIAKIIDFDLPKTSVHEYMMKFYDIDDYEEAKRLSFQYLYGNIPENIIDTNPFFKSVQEYINSKWSEYKERQFVSSDIYKRRLFAKNLPNMNKNKLFNYLIQLSETENNLQVIQELNKYLEDKESKLVLYSYDSFLIDFNMNDGVETLKDCKRIVDRDGIFPVTLKRGDNYHDMK